MFKGVEDAFNDIWGIRLGRSLLMRIVFYWTILTLGAVLFFASVAMLGAGAAAARRVAALGSAGVSRLGCVNWCVR